MKITHVNIYQHSGVWYYGAFSCDGYDHSDALNVAYDASEVDARKAAAGMFPDATVNRVEDV